jgi:Kef-type K+ transport system membrane component KefB
MNMANKTPVYALIAAAMMAAVASAFIVEDTSTSRFLGAVLVGLALALAVYAAIGRRHATRPVSRKGISSNGRSAGH